MPDISDSLPLPCGATLRNRLMKAAMTEGLAGPDGQATERHATLYRTWSEGGAGLLLTGNIMVDRRYLERPGNVVVDSRAGFERLKQWADAATTGGNHFWAQISHPGRQCSRAITSQPVAPSEVPLKLLAYFGKPRALKETEIHEIIAAYARTAAIIRDAGFTGVHVHGAHGYLISQFLSPVTNKRTDDWGGSLENRARFLLECVRAVRKSVGDDFPVALKMNSADFQKGGFTLEESCRVADMLNEEKIDLLEISGGTYEQPRLVGLSGSEKTRDEPQRESTRKREAYFLEYAKAIRAVTRIPLAVTGGFRTRESMQAALEDGSLDVIGLARPLCVEPDLPNRLMDGTAESAPRFENMLRLGPGRALGPASPVGSLKALNSLASVAWFYRQIIKLSEGQPPDPELKANTALSQHFRDETKLGMARRRWARQHA